MISASVVAILTGLLPLLAAIAEALDGHFKRKRETRSVLAIVEVDELDASIARVDEQLRH